MGILWYIPYYMGTAGLHDIINSIIISFRAGALYFPPSRCKIKTSTTKLPPVGYGTNVYLLWGSGP